MGYMSDSNRGLAAEKYVKNHFENFDVKCEIVGKEKAVEYDIIMKFGRKKYKCEVKHDMAAEKTGNIAIEYYNPKLDKPSGLGSTEADIWVFIVNDRGNKTIWGIKTEKLKKFVEENEPHRTIIAGGDKNANLYLYRDYHILEHFTRLDDIWDQKIFKKKMREIVK